MGKILIIRGGAIGDFILTLPVFSAIQANLPGNEVEVLGYPRIAELAVVGGLANRVESIESRGVAEFFARNGRLNEYYADYFSEFDLIVSFLFDPDGIFEANIGRCSPGRYIAGPHRPSEDEAIHATSCFLKPLEQLAIFDTDADPKLEIAKTNNGPASRLKTRMSEGRWLAIHPGSGSERKNWPESHWKILIRQLIRETDANLLIIGGEAEEKRLDRLEYKLPEDRVALAKNLPLSEVAQLLRLSTGFLGHDSGISHLAAAVNCPGILLWGETSMEVWRPQNLCIEVFYNPEGLSRIQPIEMFEAVLDRWLK